MLCNECDLELSLTPTQFIPRERNVAFCLSYLSFNEFDCGGRLCTCLVYLNNSKESVKASRADAGALREETAFTGGDTSFLEFNAAIPPRKGSTLFFWNTLERPGSKDYDKDILLNVDMKLRHAGK